MSNPTTPFSWQMPTATDLVTDLPADFEVFGQAVATSMADLLGGTTGQILAKNSATDMDFIWTTPNPGDITEVTAGTGLSGGGTSGAVTLSINTAVTADLTTAQTLTNKTLTSPALTTPTVSTLTTNGDLVYGTGSGALARLGIGSTSQVLTVAGGVPSWATPAAGGGFTLLSTTNITAAATISVTSINQTYKHLFVTVNNFRPSTSGDIQLYLETSGAANIPIGQTEVAFNGTSPLTSANLTGNSQGYIAKDVSQTSGIGTNSSSFWVYNYASTSLQKAITGSYGVYGVTNGNYRYATFGGSTWSATGLGAVSTLKITCSTFAAQGTIQIYGVN
jgi:hypothetical protein